MLETSSVGEFSPLAGLTICISTMNGRLIENHALVNQLEALTIPVVVVNQITPPDSKSQELANRLDHSHITILETGNRGLSRSRNEAIHLVTTSWALLCDDDVWFNLEGLRQLNECLPKHDHELAGAVVTHLLKDKGVGWRDYSNHPHEVRGTSLWAKLQIQRINSMELVLHCANMKKHGIAFRQEWGLGTQPAPGGEEVLLLNDLLEQGLELHRVDVGVRIHPDESSGSGINSTNAFVQGSTNAVVFPRLIYLALGVWLTLKHLVRRQSNFAWGSSYFKGGRWALRELNLSNK